jgi:hypothetical protein
MAEKASARPKAIFLEWPVRSIPAAGALLDNPARYRRLRTLALSCSIGQQTDAGGRRPPTLTKISSAYGAVR